MSPFIAAFGRFEVKQLAAAARSLSTAPAEPDPLAGGWGLTWCYGDRLESIRSHRPHASDPEFAKLAELRSDMALLYLHEPTARLGQREVQPFIRRDHGQTWGFVHHGRIRRPELLDTGPRLPDGPAQSERYFLHILNRLDPSDSAASVTAAQDALFGEPELSFVMLSSQLAVVSCRHDATTPGTSGHLFLGQTELLRVVSPVPVPGFADLRWEELPPAVVLVVSRERRALVDPQAARRHPGMPEPGRTPHTPPETPKLSGPPGD